MLGEAARKVGAPLHSFRCRYARGMINLRNILLAQAQAEREEARVALKGEFNMEIPGLNAGPT